MCLATNMINLHVFKVHNKGKWFSLSATKHRISKGHCISIQPADTLHTFKKHILQHNPFVLSNLIIMCYIGPMAFLEKAYKMVHSTIQLTICNKVIHMFAKEVTRLNPMCIAQSPSRFRNHVLGVHLS